MWARAGLAFSVVVRIELRRGKEFGSKVSYPQLKTPVENLSRMAEKVLPGREELGGEVEVEESLGWTLRQRRFGLSAPDFFQVLAFVADWRASMTATDICT